MHAVMQFVLIEKLNTSTVLSYSEKNYLVPNTRLLLEVAVTQQLLLAQTDRDQNTVF